MMTPEALETGFARALELAEKAGLDPALAELPVLVATACLCENLDPAAPNSLIVSAIRRIRDRTTLPPMPETVPAIIAHEFPERFEKIRHDNANPSPSDDPFARTIALGTQLLGEMLVEFLRRQAIIDAAPEFSPRQKMTMIRLLGEGILDDAQIAGYRAVADSMRHAFAPAALALLTPAEAAQYLAAQLSRLANDLVDRMPLASKEWRDPGSSSRLDDPSFQRAVRDFCEPRIALGVSGFTQEEAKTLVHLLAGATGVRVADLLAKETPLPILILHLLSQSLRLRTHEVGNEFHALMASQIDDMLHDASGQAGDIIDLPGGRWIAASFWEALRDSRMTLQWADGKSLIELEDWPELDDATRKERLQAGLEDAIATIFGGDAGQALAFSHHVMSIAPCVEALCQFSPDLNPIRLPEGETVAEWLQPETRHHEITLNGRRYGNVQFRYAHRLIAPRGLVDTQGTRHWLEARKSSLNTACSLTMTENNHFILCEPMQQICSLHLSDWPKAAYPEPVPDDFRALEHFAQDDLFAHVFASGHTNHINVVMALVAVHAFIEKPSYEGALLIQKNFIDSGIFNPLFDAGALEFPGLEDLMAHMNPGPIVEALHAVNARLDAFLDNWPQSPHHASINRLRLRIADFIALPTTGKALALSDELFAPDGQHHALLALLNDEDLEPLDDALNEVLSDVDDTVFDPLEDVLIAIITQDILPEFISSVRQAALPGTGIPPEF